MNAPTPRLTTQQLVDNLDVVKFYAAHGSPGVSPVVVLRAKGFGPAQIDVTLWDFRVGGNTRYTAARPVVAP
jgi:hypothetical protein